LILAEIARIRRLRAFNWDPSGEWIFVGGEIAHDLPPWISPEQDVGLMQCGCNLDMYATKRDGSVWYKLTDLTGSGYTGPAVTPDNHAYYAQIIDGNIFATAEDSVAAVALFSPDGSELIAAQLLTGATFPNQVTWKIKFAGRCGGDGGF
jgi:hypothetical protein